MQIYCVSCKKHTGNKNGKVFKTKQNKKWEINVKIYLFSVL